MEASVTIISDVHCHLGEGVAWLPQAQRVCWFDIVEKVLCLLYTSPSPRD